MLDEIEYKRRLRDSGMGLSESEIDKQWEMRLRRDHDHEWHVAINKHTNDKVGSEDWPRFMYEAKKASNEVERLALLFRREREGKLGTQRVQENHTFCCLGVECRKCEHLLALDKAQMPIEEIDRAKAWTCVAHILSKGGDIANEGYVLTVDDRLYWDGVYEGLASVPDDAEKLAAQSEAGAKS